MAEKKPIIVFDLGGVLIEWGLERLYGQLFNDPAELNWFLSEIVTQTWNAEMDAGKPVAQAVAERCALFPEQAALIRLFDERWPETIGNAVAGTVTIFSQLRAAGYTIHGLSNFSAETMPRIRHRFPFLEWFETLVLSGAEGVIKPDPAIYQILLERISAEAGDCLFIDDSYPNIVAARELGFDSIHFHDPTQLAADLRARGCPT